MAGHSKFKNIMFRKGAQDKKRAKIFAKLGREIQIASKQGGSDPDSNHRLRTAIDAAKVANVPKDNIERAIKKGSDTETNNLEEIKFHYNSQTSNPPHPTEESHHRSRWSLHHQLHRSSQ